MVVATTSCSTTFRSSKTNAMAVNLYEHQKQAVRDLKPGSILCGGVGSGKSRTALAFYFSRVCGGKPPRKGGVFVEMKKPIPLYIITTARKRDTKDWEREMAPFLLSTQDGVGPVDVRVDSWNNISKYVDVRDSFFIFDEQRLLGTGAWVKSFHKIAKKNKWILLSATPADTWVDYAAVFIANGFYKNITDFRNQHVVYSAHVKYPKIERYVNTRKLERLEEQILVTMPFDKESTQHHEWVKVGYDENLYSLVSDTRWNVYENKPIRNVSEWCYLLRRVVNSDHRRCTAVKHILDNHPKAIVFYNFDYELETLCAFAEKSGIAYSQWNGHRHEEIPTGDKWLYFVQYTAGAEGWNCIETDTTIFYSENYSYRIMVQASGRIDRMNTPYTDLFYYHIFSDAKIDLAIRKCLKKKKKFNEKSFAGTELVAAFA